MDLNPDELEKMILRMPSILGYSTEENLEPKLIWLEKRMNLDQDELKKQILRFSLSTEENDITPFLTFLQSRLRKSPEQLSVFIVRCRYVLGVEERIQFLRSSFELSEIDALQLVDRIPSVLFANITMNLEPTIAFVEGEIEQASARRYLVDKKPSFLKYGLKRLNERKARIDACDLPIDEGMLSRMSGWSPDKFDVYMQEHGEVPHHTARYPTTRRGTPPRRL